MDASRETILHCLEPLQDAARSWLTRDLTEPYWALFIDAVNIKTRRRDSVELEPSLVVVGVDEANRRSILAVEPGARENVESWRAVFTELKHRGLKPSGVRVGVMDGLPGLEQAFREAFPKATTCRCWIHAMRNAIAKVPARLRVPFRELAERVMYASSQDAAKRSFDKLKAAMDGDAKRAVACIEKDLDALLVHYKFDKRFWQALKTTNPVERVHREIRRRTKTMDAVGEGNLTVVIAFIALRLEAGWRRHPVDSKSMNNLGRKRPELLSSETANADAMSALAETL
jgi:transposase-like protein